MWEAQKAILSYSQEVVQSLVRLDKSPKKIREDATYLTGFDSIALLLPTNQHSLPFTTGATGTRVMSLIIILE